MRTLAKLIGFINLEKGEERGGESMYRFLRNSIILLTLSVCILTLGITAVVADGPEGSGSAPQMAPPDLLLSDSFESGAQLSAEPTPTPEAVFDIKVTTAEDGDGFVIKWKTATPAKGWIEYGTSADNFDQAAYDIRGEDVVDIVHWVMVKNMPSDAEYFFVIMADGKRYDNSGTPFQMQMSVLDRDEAVAEPVSESEFGAEPSAEPTPAPESPLNVETTPVEDGTDAFVVEWETVTPVKGWIEYGISPDELDGIAFDDWGQDVVDTQHQVTVKGLEPGTVYYYVIVSDGKKHDNAGVPFKVLIGARELAEPGEGESPRVDSSELLEARLNQYNATFLIPSPGFVGWIFGRNGHSGVDIWTGDPRASRESDRKPPPCGNEVRAAYAGTVKEIWKSRTHDGQNWRSADPGDTEAAIVVLEHWNVPGAPRNPIYTMYMHMARDNGNGTGVGTCISDNVWDYKESGQSVPAGFVLGRQGNLRLAGPSIITHLHFSVSTSWNSENAIDPSPFLGLNVRYGTTGALQYGDGVLYSGQTINGTIEPAIEQDSIYFYAGQGNRATIRMNRRSDWSNSLDSYLILYAPDGREVVRDDDSGGNYNAWINRATLPQDGRYRLVAKSWNGRSTGPYSLSLAMESGGGQPPAAPSNLRATATDCTHIRLDWNANSNDESGFRIYDGSTLVATVGANTTSYTVWGLAPSSYHCYHIYAFNDYGNSPWTDWACRATPSCGPSCLAQSPHPYSNNYNNTWTLTNPDGNAASTKLHFSRIEVENNYDYIIIRDGNGVERQRFTGTRNDAWTVDVPGRVVKVQLVTDYSVTRWGFCVNRIETGSSAGAAVTVRRVWTTDGSGNAKTSFRPGDSIQYWAEIYNNGGSTVSAYFDWRVTGPRTLFTWSGNLNIPSGASEWYANTSVPSDAPSGTYTFQVSSNYNGQTSSQSTTFTVQQGTSCPVYRAEYYNNRTLSGSPTFVRCEDWPINHNWGNGGPGHGVGNDNFSARWTGRAHIDSGTYTFIGGADDGIRMWLDGNLIINEWHDQGYTEYRVTRSVNDGDHDIKVEYYENGGAARVYFRWEQAADNYNYFRIIAKHSGKCLDVSGGSRSNGADVIQWDCHGGDNQLWRLVPVGNYYKIIAKHSGKCLDVSGASRSNGADVIQSDCHGGDNQLWRRVAVGNRFKITAKHSSKCLDVSGASRSNGADVIQWDYHGGDNQLWGLQALP